MEWLSKKILEKLATWAWSNYINKLFTPIFFNESKFVWKNIKIFILIVVFGFFFYFLPSVFVIILKRLDLQDANVYFTHLTNDIHYFHTIQYVSALFYWVIVLVLLLTLMGLTVTKTNSRLETIADEYKAAHFARAVNLVGGSRFSTQAEKNEMVELITKKFDESTTIKVMMINWFDDLIPTNSPILHALTRNCHKDIKVLLLDPFSTFAKKRSEDLANAGDDDTNWHSYIKMFLKVKNKLSHLNQDHDGKISHFVFCSRPFFRFYLFDNDLFIQVYHNKHHGRDSPMFHYQKSDINTIQNDSFFQLGVEMFDYYLKNSFQFDDDKLKAKGNPFTVYLARMYGILKDEDIKNPDELRGNVLKFVADKTEEVTRHPI